MVKPSFDICPENAEAVMPKDARMIMEVSEKYLVTMIFNPLEAKVFSIKHYPLDISGDYSTLEEIRNIISGNPDIIDNQEDIMIIYNYSESNFLPETHFRPEFDQLITRLVHGDATRGIVMHEEVPLANAVNIFRVPADVHGYFMQQFPLAKIRHIYSLVVATYPCTPQEESGTIVLKFYADRYIILVNYDNKLRLINTYFYQTPEDAVYYILAICRELDISTSTVQLLISGLIDEQSPLFAEINKFFAEVRFEAIPDSIDISGLNNELPPHYFSNLMKLGLCE